MKKRLKYAAIATVIGLIFPFVAHLYIDWGFADNYEPVRFVSLLMGITAFLATLASPFIEND